MLVREYGTPLYVYDWEHLKENIDHFSNAFGPRKLYFDTPPKHLSVKRLVKELT
jgi:diaminopimelate decarboxylase